MIQRIQTVLLFLVALLLIISLFFPVWEATSGSNTQVELDPFQITLKSGDAITAEKSVFYIAALMIVSAGIALYSIFQYKKRMLQVRLGLFNTLVLGGIIGTYFLGISQSEKLLENIENQHFLFSFYTPLLAILLNLMANRYIRKDEALVRSVDRIR
ncbi:MAG TPA: DUF4293 domain-containing protein [Cytophagaceae bacterium]